MKSGQIPGLVIGVVTANDDPTAQGKIKVRYPWLDETLESDWIPVAAPFAGPDRGFFTMPELDDEMVIGFLHGDFNHPVALGAMWNGQSEAPSPDPRQRIFRGKNGQSVRFVDSTPANGDFGALIIDDKHGNMIMMCNTHMTIKASGTLMIDGATVMIKGRTVTPNGNPI